MASSTTEDYLKQIYLLQAESNEQVSMGRLSEAMHVVPGTATAMVKKLADARFVEYEPYKGVMLTEEGRRLALDVVRRHRLIEAFLVRVLGLDWSEIHDEAEHLEHAISGKLLERIDAFLGHPQVDPHGDPIPDGSGTFNDRSVHRLAEAKPGDVLRIARVLDQGDAFLQFVDRSNLRPESRVTVISRDDESDAITVHPDGGVEVTMGSNAAMKLLVEQP